jgi:hypothetical protein
MEFPWRQRVNFVPKGAIFVTFHGRSTVKTLEFHHLSTQLHLGTAVAMVAGNKMWIWQRMPHKAPFNLYFEKK